MNTIMMKTTKLKLWSTLLLSSAAFACVSGVAATANSAELQFTQVEESDQDVSKLVRSNALHFWTWMKLKVDKGPRELKELAKHIGVVAGDPHLGNFSVIPVRLSDGTDAFRFLNIDFDDAGRAPFAVDAARLVVALKAAAYELKLKPELKQKEIFKAYIDGLSGAEPTPPQKIKDVLATRMDEYKQLVDKYVAKKIQGDQFKYEAGEIEPYKGPITVSEVQALFPQSQVLHLALRPKERGGSAESLRLWVLVREGSQKRIKELKQHAPSGLTGYMAQPAPLAWAQEVHSTFWPGIDPSSYSLVELKGHGFFWLRDKKVELVSYGKKKSAVHSFIRELALYDAQLLGLAHGRQASAAPYVAAVTANPELLRGTLKPLIVKYLAEAHDALIED